MRHGTLGGIRRAIAAIGQKGTFNRTYVISKKVPAGFANQFYATRQQSANNPDGLPVY
jgi:hypothetical protein